MDSACQPEFIRISFPEPIASISAPINTPVCSYCRNVGGGNWPGSCVIWYALVAQNQSLSDLSANIKNLSAVQLLLGHAKLESTVRYLGIEVDDALELAEQTEV